MMGPTSPLPCDACQGTGRVRPPVAAPGGKTVAGPEVKCPRCKGTGKAAGYPTK